MDLNSLAKLQRRDVSIGQSRAQSFVAHQEKITGAEILAETSAHGKHCGIRFRKRQKRPEGGAAGYSALSAIRLEQAFLGFSYDFGEKQIPHEAALEKSHISYTKGCYTGRKLSNAYGPAPSQPAVASACVSREAVPSSGEVLTADGKEPATSRAQHFRR